MRPEVKSVGAGLAVATLAYLGLRAAGITNKVAGVAIPTLSGLGAGFAVYKWSKRGQSTGSKPVVWREVHISSKIDKVDGDLISVDKILHYSPSTKGCENFTSKQLAMKTMDCTALEDMNPAPELDDEVIVEEEPLEQVEGLLKLNQPVAFERDGKTHVIIACDDKNAYALDPMAQDPEKRTLFKITEDELSAGTLYSGKYDDKPVVWTEDIVKNWVGNSYAFPCVDEVTLYCKGSTGCEGLSDKQLAEKIMGGEIAAVEQGKKDEINALLQRNKPAAVEYQGTIHILLAAGDDFVNNEIGYSFYGFNPMDPNPYRSDAVVIPANKVEDLTVYQLKDPQAKLKKVELGQPVEITDINAIRNVAVEKFGKRDSSWSWLEAPISFYHAGIAGCEKLTPKDLVTRSLCEEDVLGTPTLEAVAASFSGEPMAIKQGDKMYIVVGFDKTNGYWVIDPTVDATQNIWAGFKAIAENTDSLAFLAPSYGFVF